MCKSKYWDLKTAVDATGWVSGRSLPLQPSKPHPFADGGDNDGGYDDASKGDDDDDDGGCPPPVPPIFWSHTQPICSQRQ